MAQEVNKCPPQGAGNPLFVGGDRGMPRYLIRFSRIRGIVVYLEGSFRFEGAPLSPNAYYTPINANPVFTVGSQLIEN